MLQLAAWSEDEEEEEEEEGPWR